MAWIDDITARIEQVNNSLNESELGKSVNDYLQSRLKSEAVKILKKAPAGNLSQAQIDAGMRGAGDAVALGDASLATTGNAIQGGQTLLTGKNFIMPIAIILGALVLYKMLKKR